MAQRPLTSKQRKFVEVYAGNGTEAARLAGYSGSDNVLAQCARSLLRNPQIHAAIKAREIKELRGSIASRADRQEFWTRTMLDHALDYRDRLKASELLGRSEADFAEKLHVVGRLTLEELVVSSMKPSEGEGQ